MNRSERMSSVVMFVTFTIIVCCIIIMLYNAFYIGIEFDTLMPNTRSMNPYMISESFQTAADDAKFDAVKAELLTLTAAVKLNSDSLDQLIQAQTSMSLASDDDEDLIE